jgi:hypothetical protein
LASTSPSRKPRRASHRSAGVDENGGYVIPNLPVGSVPPRGESARLPLLRPDRHRATVNATPAINVVLALGEVSEQISVRANAAMVETRQHRRRTVDRKPARPRAAAERPPGHRTCCCCRPA